jgi:hypothetical protein
MMLQAHVRRVAQAVAARVSPRHRRWRKFLDGFSLVPHQLEEPVPEPGPRDFIICGSPRSGTTMLSAALFQPPMIITYNEPWDGMRLAPKALFELFRREIDAGRVSKGRLDIPRLLEKGEVRWTLDGEIPVGVSVQPDYLVGVKWPAFWQYLPLLHETRFLVTVRDPFETISSYKKKGGALLDGLDYPVAFNRRINDTIKAKASDPELRRVLLYELINQEILRHIGEARALVVRYERWFDDREGLREEISDFLEVDASFDHLKIRRSGRGVDLTTREFDLIRTHCESASAWGYDLNQDPTGAL